MKKSTIYIYIILFIFLIFFAVKLYSSEKKYNGINTLDLKTSINYKEFIIKDHPFSQENKYQQETYSKQKVIEHELLAKFKLKPEDKTEKEIYKIIKNNKCGLLNENEEKITKIIYDDFLNFDEEKGIFVSILNGKKGLMNYRGKILVPAGFETIKKTEYPHLVIVKRPKFYGLYDIKLAKEVINPIYTSITPYDEKNWKIESNNKFGFVHYENGKSSITKPKYNEIEAFSKYLVTRHQNKLGLIDLKTGETISDTKYDEISLLNKNTIDTDNIYIYKTKIDNRYGLIYYTPKELTIIAPIYDEVIFDTHVNVLSHGYWRTLDNKGNVISRNSYATR